MRILLDTQVVLWRLREPHRLGSRAEEAILSAREVRLSVVSFIEIGIKVAARKLQLGPGIEELATSENLLEIASEHGLHIAKLPLHHRDPFDRLLIAQAMTEDLVIVTSDPDIPKYDVRTIDAER